MKNFCFQKSARGRLKASSPLALSSAGYWTGFYLMIASAVCGAFSVYCTYIAMKLEPEADAVYASLLRVCVHPLVWGVGYLGWSMVRGYGKNGYWGAVFFDPKQLVSRGSIPLGWLCGWGISGACTVLCYYSSLRLASMSVASLGASLSAIVTTVLSALFSRKLNDRKLWICVFLSSLGVGALFKGNLLEGNMWGGILALLSGIMGGIAYFCLSPVAARVTTFEIMSSWFLFSAPIHVLVIYFQSATLPHQIIVWCFFVIAGILLSLSQFLAALAFRFERAEMVSLLSYLTPLLVCLFDFVFFSQGFDLKSCVGILCIMLTAYVCYLRKIRLSLLEIESAHP